MLRILHDTKYDFIKYWKHAAIGTVAFIVLGLALLSYHKERTGTWLNESIEFTGGTLMQLRFAKAPNIHDIRTTVEGAGFAGPEITQFGAPTEFTVRAQPHAGTAVTTSA